MENTRIIAKNLWRDGTIIAYSSQDPQYPAVCTQDDNTTLGWRSRNGAGSGNGVFIVDAYNGKIDFDEGAGEIEVALSPGIYTGASLAAHIKVGMDLGGGTYNVTYTENTGQFTIERPAGNFSLLWATGSSPTTNAAGLLGFDNSADDTGLSTYSSDYIRIHYPAEYIDIDLGTAKEYDFISLRGHNLTSSATITLTGADDAGISVSRVSDNITQANDSISAFLATARTKRYVRIYVSDYDNPAGYIEIGAIVLGKYQDLGAQFNRGYGRGKVNESEADESPSLDRFLVVSKPTVERWRLPYTGLSATARGYIDDAVDECCGSVYGMIFCFDYTDPNSNTYWVRMIESDIPENLGATTFNWSVTIEEHV